MNSLVSLIKRRYWDYCSSPKKSRITGLAFSKISRILTMLNKVSCLKYVVKSKINLFLVLLETNDNIIYESINRNYVKSTKYISQSTLIERENISEILFYYFIRSNKIEFGIKVFEELATTDPDNKKNWRGLLDLPFYINDEKRVNKYSFLRQIVCLRLVISSPEFVLATVHIILIVSIRCFAAAIASPHSSSLREFNSSCVY